MGTHQALDDDGILLRAQSITLERLHVEHIHTLELSQQLEALETRRLRLVRGDLTGLGTLTLDDRGRVRVGTEHGRGAERPGDWCRSESRGSAKRTDGTAGKEGRRHACLYETR